VAQCECPSKDIQAVFTDTFKENYLRTHKYMRAAAMHKQPAPKRQTQTDRDIHTHTQSVSERETERERERRERERERVHDSRFRTASLRACAAISTMLICFD